MKIVLSKIEKPLIKMAAKSEQISLLWYKRLKGLVQQQFDFG
jgi:hypothetical protein